MSQMPRFTFTWYFHNFSMCPLKQSQLVYSPEFVVKLLGNSEWQLMLQPKGVEKHKNSIPIYLLCRSAGTNSSVVKTDFAITVYSDDAKSLVTKKTRNHVFQKKDKCGFGDFMSRKDLFDNKEAYLPNDTLTIKCTMWPSEVSENQKSDSASALTNQATATGVELNSQFTGEWNDCSVATRVEVQNKNISWAIKNFNSLSFDERLTIPVKSAIKEAPSFRITLYKSLATQSVEIEIQREAKSESEQVFFKCKASVFYSPKGMKYLTEDVHLFLPDTHSIWKLPSFIQLERLEEDKYLNNTANVLHLRFEFSYSKMDDMYYFERVSFRQYGTFVTFSEPIEELRQLYKAGEVYDVVIRVGDRDFKVLKTILRARSPVFGAIFDSDMKEGVVDISDVDADTLDRMLAFMYSNALEDLKVEDAIKLYSAADRYKVFSLKFRCGWIMAPRICASNVCEVLILADRHDDYLRDCAESFVRENSMPVLKSLEWTNLIKDYGTLAANVMLRMLTC